MKVPQRTNVSEIIITAALYHVDNGLDVPFDKFESSDFPTVREQKIWRAVKDVKSLTGTADPFSVRAKLSDEDEPVGGWDRTLDYFKNLVVENFSYYVGIFSEEVRRYRAWVAASNIADRLASGEEIETAWPEFIEANPENLELLHASDIEAFRKHVMEERINTATHKFMLSGYPDLDDRLTYKFMLKKMSVISGRAKMGKSLSKYNLIYNILKAGHPVYSWEPEMGKELAVDTLTSIGTGVPMKYIGNPKIGLQREPDFIQKIQQFDRNVFPKFDLTIDDSSCYSVDELLRRVRICNLQRLKQGKKKISLLYLDNTDNLGEISNETNAGAMSYKIGQIFRKQQDFARTEDLHIGNLWQISRATEDNSRKKDRRPTLADLAFSDAVVRVVDWILLVYRESYYNPGQDDGETELIIAAQRGGGGNRASVKVYKDLNSELLKSRVQNQNISERATALL